MKYQWLTGITCLCICSGGYAQQDSVTASGKLEEVVVTATKSARPLQEVPMPVTVINRQTIEKMGSMRLNEVLAEQTGLQIVSDHGTGIQMQGMSADYVLILIDGEPLIGRNAGTLDLSRITIANIERIEIVKGPASSLYGSEAMGGVINIITRKLPSVLTGSLHARQRKYSTTDVTAEMGQQLQRFGWSAFGNYYRTNGYYTVDSISKAIPSYRTYTAGTGLRYALSSKINFSLNARLYREEQENKYLVTGTSSNSIVGTHTNLTEVTVTPTLSIQLNSRQRLQVKNYYTSYRTRTTDNTVADGKLYDESYFNQSFNRTEAQYDLQLSSAHLTTAGAGNIIEVAKATRYDNRNTFNQQYLFAQHQWQVNNRFNLVAGLRFDKHNEYASRLSPKLAMQYRFARWITVKASAGGGYKAPTFSQLLLNFTNPLVGYTVLGNRIITENVQKLQQNGQIASLYIAPATIPTIKAESSMGYNAGADITPVSNLRLSVNLFRNNIKDLIDTRAIALKTNGQNVFSYFNYNNVFTQGVDVQLTYTPARNLTLSAGYQYLEAKDQEVLNQIKAGKIYYRDANGDERKVKTSQYGGLYNRSKHSGNVKLNYENKKYAFNVMARAIYRGRFGYGGDVNANSILDDKREYADGYTVCNLAVQKSIRSIVLEAGVNNVFKAASAYDPTLAPTVWYGGVIVKFGAREKSILTSNK